MMGKDGGEKRRYSLMTDDSRRVHRDVTRGEGRNKGGGGKCQTKHI